MKKHNVLLSLPKEFYKKIKDIAEKKGFTVSTVIKIALDEYLKRNE